VLGDRSTDVMYSLELTIDSSIADRGQVACVEFHACYAVTREFLRRSLDCVRF
jgi:hypothetical protein